MLYFIDVCFRFEMGITKEKLNNGLELTPMMQQYMETKSNIRTVSSFTVLETFYEMFLRMPDSVRELEITLTGKNCGQEERAPMCGVPYHYGRRIFKPAGEQGLQGCHL